jgi:transglutaminase-like putative cysteine protease
MLKKLVLLVPLLLIFSTVSAQDSAGQEITNPEAVSYLHAEVTRSGYVYLFDNSPFQTARDLTVTLTLPQNTSRQESYIKSVAGPDRYYVGEDAWGNKVVNLYWGIPDLKKRLYYTIVSDVEVSDGMEAQGNAKFPVTDFTKATTGIAQVTFDLTYGLDDTQRFFRLAEWVHKNVKYDNEAKSFSQSAAWTFLNRKGACDEFSNLLVSMLRVLGYEPRYVVGYAYSENWGQHGWVEVDYNGRTVSLDPTWLESPVDSTHIKVAELPDSNLTEHVEVKGGTITIDWEKNEPEIKVLSRKESPKIDIGASLIPENSSSGGYSLLATEFTAPGCILTNVQIKSCTMLSEGDFLSIPVSSQTLAFCGSQKAYWFLKTPVTEGGMVYTCPVLIYGAGAEKSVAVNVGPGQGSTLGTSVKSQNVFTPGQVFEVESVTENSGFATQTATVYVFFGGSVQSKDFTLKPGQSASIKWTLKAPSAPGSYELTVFSSSGEMASRNITVIQQRHIQIQNISAPDKASAKRDLTINVTVKAITSFSGIANITIGDYSDTRGIFLGPSGTKTFQIHYTPQSAGAKIMSVAIFSDSQQYEDGWWGTLEVQNERQWWDELLDWLQGIVDSIIRAFTGG